MAISWPGHDYQGDTEQVRGSLAHMHTASFRRCTLLYLP